MISVPEAALLPKYPRPVRRAKSSSRDGGKPWGYVRNGRSSITPQISQCPVVESFPWDLGSATPYAAVALTPGASPGIFRDLPNPNRSKFGSRSPPTPHVNHHQVHRHAPDYRARRAVQEHGRLGSATEQAPHAVGVADPERRDRGVAGRGPGGTVADALALPHRANAHHARAQRN